jgi:hypothetical protein
MPSRVQSAVPQHIDFSYPELETMPGVAKESDRSVEGPIPKVEGGRYCGMLDMLQNSVNACPSSLDLQLHIPRT